MHMLKRAVGVLAGATIALAGWAIPASAATTGTQRFTFIVRDSASGESCTVIATGPISGAGTCVLEDVSEEVTVVHVTLPGGRFDFTATSVDEQDDFNEQACIFRFTANESFEISGVSGAYATATGSGSDTIRGTFFGCSEETASGFIVARATGTVTV
jgi:hypothetical protein